MKKIILALAVLLSSSAPAYAEPFSYATRAVVRVDCGDTIGSAVHVGKGEYVTAAHVVDGGQCFVDGTPITDTKIDTAQDVATFHGPVREQRMKVSCSVRFNEDEKYAFIGYAFGRYEQVRMPMLSAGYREDGFDAFVGADAIPGMSGGAVVNRYGRLIGVVNMRWPSRSRAISNSFVCRR